MPGWRVRGVDQHRLDTITYDANGNILSLLRKGHLTGDDLVMDSRNYHYASNKNQLTYVDDSVSSGTYSNDFDDQAQDNYNYDAIGNLVRDDAEGISQLEWLVNGKIKSIIRDAGTKSNLYFEYGPDGQRVYKKVVLSAGEGVATEIWYVRNADGDVMVVYQKRNDSLFVKEQYIYGTARLGSLTDWRYVTALSLHADTNRYHRTLGRKFYELSTHQNNILATVTDQKKAIEDNGIIDYWMPKVNSYSDFFPFGMQMLGRTGAIQQYTYSFQGQETDDEMYGDGNAVGYTYRVHDPRIGRFLSIDPLFKDYPWNSPYAFSENKLISHIELEGLESHPTSSGTDAKPDGTRQIERDNTTSVQNVSVKTVEGKNKIIGPSPEDFPVFKAPLSDLEKKYKNLQNIGERGTQQLIVEGALDLAIGEVAIIKLGKIFSKYWKYKNAIKGTSDARSSLFTADEVIKTGTSLWPAASGGRTVINGIEYTTHALERMQPVGTIMKGTGSFSRGVPPSVVENAIKYGKVTPGNTAEEVIRTFENVRVITNPQGTLVISVIKIGS